MVHVRTQIRVNNTEEAVKLVSLLNSDGTADKYIIENNSGEIRVNARSLLGVIYMSTEYNEHMYLVNCYRNGQYPVGIDQFRF
jgi:hypothetical protein